MNDVRAPSSTPTPPLVGTTRQRYWVEEAEAPLRCRLQRRKLKFSRDVSKWEKRAPGASVAGASGGSVVSDEGDGFFAFPLAACSSRPHHVVRCSGGRRRRMIRTPSVPTGGSDDSNYRTNEPHCDISG